MKAELKAELERRHPCSGCKYLTYELVEMSFDSSAPYLVDDVWVPLCSEMLEQYGASTVAVLKCDKFEKKEPEHENTTKTPTS